MNRRSFSGRILGVGAAAAVAGVSTPTLPAADTKPRECPDNRVRVVCISSQDCAEHGLRLPIERGVTNWDVVDFLILSIGGHHQVKGDTDPPWPHDAQAIAVFQQDNQMAFVIHAWHPSFAPVRGYEAVLLNGAGWRRILADNASPHSTP